MPSGSPARIAPIAPTARRCPHRAHRVPTSASPPPSLSLRCGGPRALTGKNRTVCIPFSPNARKRPPSWQHPPEMHAFRDQDGNILALCVHSRAQSGDSGCMARESCRQGPFFASRSPKSRMARRCCQRRPAFPPSRPRSSPPSYTRRASPPASRPPCAAIRRTAHCGRGEPSIRLFLLPSCCPRRRIAPTDARSPAPPEPQPAPTEPRPRANRASPACGATCAHPRSATRRASPCRVGPAAVLVIPVKWCGDTIAHTRKLRF